MLTDVHLPLLPFQNVSVHLEADALRLDDVQRFDVISELEFLSCLLRVLRQDIGEVLLRRHRRRHAWAVGGFDVVRASEWRGLSRGDGQRRGVCRQVMAGEVDVDHFSSVHVHDGDEVLSALLSGKSKRKEGNGISYQRMAVQVVVL